MKILSYNINRCSQQKIDKILSMGADIMVLPECAHPKFVNLPDGYAIEWMGKPEKCDWKGLGIIWRKEHNVAVVPWFNEAHNYIMPFIVDGEFLLIATWPTLVPEAKKTYPQILLEMLKEYEEHFSQTPTLICGDFNCYIGQTAAAKKTGSFEQCIDFMKDRGLYDLYHQRTGEDFGKESRATYYHQFKETMPFFIDFAFTNMPVFAYELGKWDKDVSDHCPQMIVL